MLTALTQLNVELTSRCDKKTICFCCGHQVPGGKYGDMDFGLLESIACQISPPVIVSFHRDGDPLVYPRLGEALRLFQEFPRSIVTHGEALNARFDEIINNATTVTVSVVPNDPDRELQLESLRGFLKKKGDRPPMLQLKFVGIIHNPEPYLSLGLPVIGRALHSKKGNWNYYKIDPIIPEVRVCLDFLGRPTVDWKGNLYNCNRLDISGAGLLGNLNESTLEELWNGPERARMLRAHLAGRRQDANPLCASCEFWGISTPSGG